MINQKISHWELSASATVIVKDTAGVGRAVFSNTRVAKDELLLSTTPELSPIAHVILRPYRREVCSWCFLYDRGREWKVRDASTATAFCSIQCQKHWVADNDGFCLEAHQLIESFIKSKSNSTKSATLDHEPFPNLSILQNPPSLRSVSVAWKIVEDLGMEIITARDAERPLKTQRALLRTTTDLTPDPDILSYALSGILAAYKSRESKQNNHNLNLRVTHANSLLPSLYELMPDDAVFFSNPMTTSPLKDYAHAYLVLLRLLPKTMLDLVSTDFVINLASRASHNAFSIRPEGTTDGDQSGEFFGWGVWPEASFFNHSCHPNVRKERRGRVWSFYLDNNDHESLEESRQLCITYLGGDEKDLNVYDRRKRLQDQWGFLCMCDRCQEESEEKSSSEPQ